MDSRGLVVVGAVAVGAAAGAAVTWLLVSRQKQELLSRNETTHNSSNMSETEPSNLRRRGRSESWAEKQREIKRALADKTLRPPLPPSVQEALMDNASQCVLSTFPTAFDENEAQGEDNTMDPPQPHLSLMSFTYVASEEVVVMSTQRETRKFRHILQSPEVAVLVTAHDGAISITLNGSASVEKGAEAERLRAIHLAANPEYPQFIVGDNIAIIAIHITHARICNIRDEVKHWAVTGS